MAGRRPKPLAMHKLNGNPSMLSKAELSGRDNPQPKLAIPEMPKGMPPLARREWKKMTQLLFSNGLLSLVDGKALMGYCVAYANWQNAQRALDQYGAVIRTEFQDNEGETHMGDLKSNPAAAQVKVFLALMKSFLIEFGMTPASRRNLKVDKSTPNDPMEEFMKRDTQERPLLVPTQPDEDDEDGK